MTEYGRIHTDGSRSGGQPLQSDVERVARALAQADGIEICSDATYALSSYGHKAQAALAAMRQPTHRNVVVAAAPADRIGGGGGLPCGVVGVATQSDALREALERIEAATRNEVRAGDKGYISRYGINGIARAALGALGFEIKEKSK